ncbi:MAG: hypothetical protein JSS96_13255 [Bacteroidetes bacterium]|nr:hypothetical protein [Bacteroidota bacterium]
MRSTLLEVQEIDRYLLGEMSAEEKAVFQARMLIAPVLNTKVRHQRIVHKIVKWFGREEQRKKLETLYTSLLRDDKFKQEIEIIFK